MRISALVAALAFGVSAQSAPRFTMSVSRLAHHCRDIANKYLLTQRLPGSLTYPFCHELAKSYHDAPSDKSKDHYYFNCFCMNQVWAEAYTGCLTNVGQWRNNRFKNETDRAKTDRCWACHKFFSDDYPYQYPTIYNCLQKV